MSRVAIVRCEDYDSGRVEESVARLFDLLGGAGSLLPPGKRILLKPNLLKGAPPGEGRHHPSRSAPRRYPHPSRLGAAGLDLGRR